MDFWCRPLPRIDGLLIALLAFIATAATQTGEAATVVTLSAPTGVEAFANNSTDAQRFESADIGLFDKTATATGGQNGGSAGASSHLRVDITPEQIEGRVVSSAGASSSSSSGSAWATYEASFALQIVTDAPTPFFFEGNAEHGGRPSGNPGFLYRFYSEEFDHRFVLPPLTPGGFADGSTSWSFGGVLEPGVTYYLELAVSGGASAPFRNSSSFMQSASARLIIPEPSCVALVFASTICLCLRRRSV